MNGAMKGRTVLVTGSTDGIGKATALGRPGWAQRCSCTVGTLKKAARFERRSPGRLAATSSISSSQTLPPKQVRRLAAEVVERHERLHVLINNAGTFQAERRLTEDSLETTFAVNYLAPFLRTHELLELLEESSPSRIISVASIAHLNAKVDWNNLHGERWYDDFEAYALSK